MRFDKTKTLFISDLDGTLLNPQAELSYYSLQALNGMIADGLNFSIATARTPASAGVILSELTPSMPVVLMNGSLIYDRAQKKYIRVSYIEPETASKAAAAISNLKMNPFFYELKGEKFSVWNGPLDTDYARAFMMQRKKKYYKNFIQFENISDVPTDAVIYITMIDELERVLAARAELQKIDGLGMVMYRDVYPTFSYEDLDNGAPPAKDRAAIGNLWFLEAYRSGVSKKSAAIYIKESFGFEKLIGFGDNVNDLPMFEACDYRLAVENAFPEVLAASDETIGSSDTDGVVKWIARELGYDICL